MKRAWSKKLSAFALTLVLLVGMVPYAMAVDCADGADSWDNNWIKVDDATHQRKCLISGCNKVQTAKHTFPSAYETDASAHWKKCSDCGAQTAHQAHSFTTALQKDSSSHWEQCSVCGYRANEGGHIDKDLNGKCDTCGYDMGSAYVSVTFRNGSDVYKTQSNVIRGKTPNNPGTPSKSVSGKTYTFKGWTTSNPGSSALYTGQAYLTSSAVASTVVTASTTYYALYTVSGTSLTYTVKPGEKLTFDRSDFKELFDDAFSDDSFRYVTFEADSSLKSSNGVLYHNYGKSDQISFTRSDVDDYDFYYKSDDYLIDNLTFVADSGADDKTVSLEFTLYGRDEELDGTLEIEIGKHASSKADIVYEVDAGDSIDFDRSDFRELFEDSYSSDTFRYVTFEADSSLKSSNGVLYHDYKGSQEEEFDRSDVDDYDFYYKSDDYLISQLTFVADDDADGEVVTLEFTLYGDSKKLDGTLRIEIGDVDSDSDKGDIDYTVEPGEEVDLDDGDFYQFFKEEYSNSLRYVTFTPDNSYKSSNGVLYYDYDGRHEEEFSKSDLNDLKFYYSSDSYGDYPLDDLTFVADDDFDGVVTMKFRACYDSSKYVDGELTIRSERNVSTKSAGDIRYYTTYSSSVQLNHNDFARFFKTQYPTSSLQYVKITGVPTSGTIIYDAFGTSKYGSSKIRITADNCKDYTFYFSPDSTKDYALSELSFSPNGFNYCPTISFTAYGSGSRSVSGTILISVTLGDVPDVYGVTPKGTAVSFPASALSSAVSAGTGLSLASIRLLALPEATAGTVYVGSGTGTKANTSDRYTYASGYQSIGQLRFVPAANFTGSVELPYLAYNSSGNLIAGGKFCLGVVKATPNFSDVTASSWCYKYVAEMSDSGVIDGYYDHTFRPNTTVTYAQALKLIMLSTGYSVQSPTGSHWASGYLSRAKSDNLVSGSVDLDAPITRLALAQLAAKAMKLSTSDLSSVKPFTDTSDVYVQALSAAGIVEGYFSNGTSTFRPSSTLTRGQISAIVWRIQQYRK